MTVERNLMATKSGEIDGVIITNQGTVERCKWFLAKLQVIYLYYIFQEWNQ